MGFIDRLQQYDMLPEQQKPIAAYSHDFDHRFSSALIA
jgi:hypothetical protein